MSTTELSQQKILVAASNLKQLSGIYNNVDKNKCKFRKPSYFQPGSYAEYKIKNNYNKRQND